MKKLYAHKDQWHFWTAVKFNISTLLPRRYNAILGYKEKEYDLFLQHESRDELKDAKEPDWGTITLSSYYRDKSYTLGFKGSFLHWNKPEERLTATLGALYKVDDNTTVKAKVDLNANLSLVWKHIFTKNLTGSVSTGINLRKPDDFVSQKKVPVPIGFQFDFSYWVN